jgi:signal transduction histidine kinase
MQVLLDDLVDFNRSKLGLGLNVVPDDIDLAAELAVELEQLRAVRSGRLIEFAVNGDCRGHWDSRRLKQVLRNLVSNAIEYGSADTPVNVVLVGEKAEVRLEVLNQGPTIDPSVQGQLFEPLTRGVGQSRNRRDRLGLGLFIVRQIALAHGGRVAVSSGVEMGTTTFAVSLPRQKTATPPDHTTKQLGSPRHEPARVSRADHPQDSPVSGSDAA